MNAFEIAKLLVAFVVAQHSSVVLALHIRSIHVAEVGNTDVSRIAIEHVDKNRSVLSIKHQRGVHVDERRENSLAEKVAVSLGNQKASPQHIVLGDAKIDDHHTRVRFRRRQVAAVVKVKQLKSATVHSEVVVGATVGPIGRSVQITSARAFAEVARTTRARVCGQVKHVHSLLPNSFTNVVLQHQPRVAEVTRVVQIQRARVWRVVLHAAVRVSES
mmetsp:Transcript_255/g.617  ORF Transcript_255/g.617 Transcript_255/m.617 type:complete len:217 (+) Transcript_255:1590-2240(+)